MTQDQVEHASEGRPWEIHYKSVENIELARSSLGVTLTTLAKFAMAIGVDPAKFIGDYALWLLKDPRRQDLKRFVGEGYYEDKRVPGKVGTVNSQKTHCGKGHPYAGENLMIAPGGARRCRKCDLASSLRRARVRRKKRTHCTRGHEINGHNVVIVRYQSKDQRRCRKCHYAAIRARDKALREYRERKAK